MAELTRVERRRPRPRRPGGAEQRLRAGRQRGGRLARTIVLGALVVFLGIAWLARELELDVDELLDYALTSLLLVGGLVALAILGAVLLRLVRRLLR